MKRKKVKSAITGNRIRHNSALMTEDLFSTNVVKREDENEMELKRSLHTGQIQIKVSPTLSFISLNSGFQ